MFLNKLLIYRLFVFLVLTITILFLLSGSEFLVWRVKILFGFHTGTVAAWLGLTSASLLAISINRRNYRLRALSSLSFYVAIFWLLISFLLAGNNNLIFLNKPIAFYTWIVICALPILVLLISLFYNSLILFVRLLRR